jgi:hypothetical protein
MAADLALGIHVADVRTVDELAGYVDLAELRAP